ncbi:unnamed protein product [Debaryomyces tyrocola]|nr:unnamed protein product [Debaryomyces tyrocola]
MNAKDAMKFMGLCNYYRKFVQGFSRISSPINEFMAEHCQWGETQDEAIQRAQNKEIIGIAGYDKLTQKFDIYWLDCHPGHSSSLTKKMFFHYVPEIQRNSLLANLRVWYPDLV